MFCRFAGCKLWSGREADRASAQCRFCDTEFVGTGGTLGARFELSQSFHFDAAHSLRRSVARDSTGDRCVYRP